MSGMEPMIIGAAAGAALNRKNPLQGAVMGGALGGAGGALFPNALSSLAPAAGGSGILPSAASGSMTAGANIPTGAAFINPAGVNAATAATTGPSGLVGVEAAKGGLFGGGIPATNAAMQGQNLAQTTAMQRPLSLGMPGVEPGQGYEYTLGDRLGQVGQFAQQNPVLTQMAAQTGQSLLSQQQPTLPPAGLIRGNQMQVATPQYQVGIPKVSLI
jgi:hypothetical protein